MIRPDSSPEVHELACKLGIDTTDPAVGIVVDCRRLVDSWVSQAGGIGPQGISDISAFESLITRKLSMVVEEIHTDEDFDRLTDKYARGLGDYVFAGLRAKFDDPELPAFGVLIERNTSSKTADDLFVAVIDCRVLKRPHRPTFRWDLRGLEKPVRPKICVWSTGARSHATW